MTLGERIKKVRKEKDLTQREFGRLIGIKPNSISLIESGDRNASEQVVLSICREFNVSEEWLRTEEGEMFIPEPCDALETFIRERKLSPSDRVLIQKFAALDAQSRQAVVDYVITVSDEILKARPAPVSDAGKDISVLTPAPDIMSELTELKRQSKEKDKQLQELAAEIAALKEEDELNWPSDTENLA